MEAWRMPSQSTIRQTAQFESSRCSPPRNLRRGLSPAQGVPLRTHGPIGDGVGDRLGRLSAGLRTLRIAARVGTRWHCWATFRRVFITDLHGQDRFRTLVPNGSVHSPAARTTGSRSGAWDDPSGPGDAAPVSGVGTRVAGPADHRPARRFQDLGAHRFRSSEMVATIGRSVKNPERAVGLLYLYCATFCRFR
jgi:hypothetical protein